MARKPFSISAHVTVNPGVKIRTTIWTVPQGAKAIVREMVVNWPVATYGELKIRLLYGEMPVIPRDGWATGDNATIRYTGEVEYGSGTPVQVELENTSDTDVHEAFITLRGELEE